MAIEYDSAPFSLLFLIYLHHTLNIKQLTISITVLDDMLDRTKMIYKGDVLAGSFYLFLGIVSAITSVLLHFFSTKLGYYYLKIGMAVFACYMIGKGCIMIYMYWSRCIYYKSKNSIDQSEVRDEQEYTLFRIKKKQRSRRIYMYIILLGSFIAFGGIFHQEKGLIVGTCIPIVLLSGVEFCIGLLTEFRLSEYLRQLRK